MQTLFNKTLAISASFLSVAGLMLISPQSVSAQEMSEEMDAVETVEMDSVETDAVETEGMGVTETENVDAEEVEVTGTSESEEDTVGQSAEMETGVEMETDVEMETTVDSSSPVVEEEVEATTYSNSPRALW